MILKFGTVFLFVWVLCTPQVSGVEEQPKAEPPKTDTPKADADKPAPPAAKPDEAEKPAAPVSKQGEDDEPWKKLTKAQIDAITYEECDDDNGVTFPFFADFDRVGDSEDRKKEFADWKEKLEKWDCKNEEKTIQRVRNYVSLMSLVDILQMEWEGETPKILFERMQKEIPKDDLIKACAYIALKPDEGTVIDKCPDMDIDDGAAEDRVRERVGVYAKKVLGRLLGKLPPKEEAEEKKDEPKK
ncbi:MAG TPA: hypothetical protein VKX17_08440 [Planctomycetota bacterium]|nr:hypothetical protein [Planctomycetota bacterium]